MLTLIVTGSCLRVLGESYREAAAAALVEGEGDGENNANTDNDVVMRDGGGGADDDAFWNPYYEYNQQHHPNGTTSTTTTTSSSTAPFHYTVAFQTVSNLPIEVAFGLFSLLCAWSLTSLTCFHALIITLAQTTNERVRGVYQYGGIGNPADEGCVRNWWGVCCHKTPESRLPGDFSDVVTLLPTMTGNTGNNSEGGDGEKEGLLLSNNNGDGESRSVVEESLWPGWQYSQSFTALMNAPPPPMTNQSP